MRVKLTKMTLDIEAETQQEADQIKKFLFDDHADLLWMNGAVLSTNSAEASMLIRKLSKQEKQTIRAGMM